MVDRLLPHAELLEAGRPPAHPIKMRRNRAEGGCSADPAGSVQPTAGDGECSRGLVRESEAKAPERRVSA